MSGWDFLEGKNKRVGARVLVTSRAGPRRRHRTTVTTVPTVPTAIRHADKLPDSPDVASGCPPATIAGGETAAFERSQL
eukprot:65075-Prymnesium_polylepis.1